MIQTKAFQQPAHRIEVLNPRPPRELFAHCSGCGEHSWFDFHSVKRAATGSAFSPAIRLWTCEHCHIILSESNLRR